MISQLLQTINSAQNQWTKLRAELCAEFRINASERNLLEYLSNSSSHTISQIAQQIGVSRQHVQIVVQQLLNKSLVALHDNPAHKRSMFVGLTSSGERVINQMIEKEQQVIDKLSERFLDEDVELTTRTLHALSLLLNSLACSKSDHTD